MNQMTFKQISELMKGDINSLDQLLTTRLASDVALINQISAYIIASGGKRIRPLILMLLWNAISASSPTNNPKSNTKLNTEHKYIMAAVIELIHTATLLHDDVVDESDTRRGNSTAHTEWGNSAAILVGDFLYSRSFELMVEPNSMAIMQTLASATNKIAEGEVLQLLNCGKVDLSEQDYFTTIERKTAVLFEAASLVAGHLTLSPTPSQINSQNLTALSRFGINLGNAFQIIDDILDYKSSSADMGKEVGDDLAEGKVTLPLIYALKNTTNADKQTLEDAINNQDTSNIDKIIAILDEVSAFDYAFKIAQKSANQAKQNLDFLTPSIFKDALINLCDLSLQRKS